MVITTTEAAGNAKLKFRYQHLGKFVIHFCHLCGSTVKLCIPEGDTLLRHVCSACGHIHYENPRMILGCIAEYEGKILLCRRAIEPRLGLWTLPAGFMENAESTQEGARRETREEAGAEVVIDAPFALVSIAHINQVHFFYRAHLLSPTYSAGAESLEVELFPLQAIPWSKIAFPSVTFCMERYLSDYASGKFGFHETALLAGRDKSVF